MKPRDYCCCAIPIVNAGVYATLLEQLVAGAVIGVLALATPDSTPICNFALIHTLTRLQSSVLQRLHLLLGSLESCASRWPLFKCLALSQLQGYAYCHYFRPQMPTSSQGKIYIVPSVSKPSSHASPRRFLLGSRVDRLVCRPPQ